MSLIALKHYVHGCFYEIVDQICFEIMYLLLMLNLKMLFTDGYWNGIGVLWWNEVSVGQ